MYKSSAVTGASRKGCQYSSKGNCHTNSKSFCRRDTASKTWRSPTALQVLQAAPPSSSMTGELLAQALRLALLSRLRHHDSISVSVGVDPWGLLSGRFKGFSVHGAGWRTPLELTAQRLEVHIGEMAVDYSALVFRQSIQLTNIPNGKMVLTLSPRDLGNFMTHPIMKQAAARSVQGKAFYFDRSSISIKQNGANGEGTVIFEGVWQGDGQRYRAAMTSTIPGRSTPPMTNGHSNGSTLSRGTVAAAATMHGQPSITNGHKVTGVPATELPVTALADAMLRSDPSISNGSSASHSTVTVPNTMLSEPSITNGNGSGVGHGTVTAASAVHTEPSVTNGHSTPAVTASEKLAAAAVGGTILAAAAVTASAQSVNSTGNSKVVNSNGNRSSTAFAQNVVPIGNLNASGQSLHNKAFPSTSGLNAHSANSSAASMKSATQPSPLIRQSTRPLPSSKPASQPSTPGLKAASKQVPWAPVTLSPRTRLTMDVVRLESEKNSTGRSVPEASSESSPAVPDNSAVVAAGLHALFTELVVMLQGIELCQPSLSVRPADKTPRGSTAISSTTTPHDLLEIEMKVSIKSLPPLDMSF